MSTMTRLDAARAKSLARVQSRRVQSAGARPSTNVALRAVNPDHCAGDTARRTRCAPMTAAQRNSLGQKSEWNASPYFFTAPAWSDTRTSMPRGER